MKTFTQFATDYTTLSRDTSAANLALGKSLMNTFIPPQINFGLKEIS